MVKDYALYSSTIHKNIFAAYAVLLGLLQIISTFADRIDMLRGFLVLFLIYVVLILCEEKLGREPGLIYYCVGNLSHLIGTFAADMLVFLIFPIFALVIAILCLSWFIFVMHLSFAKTMPMSQPETADPELELPPV
ncbi:uncharacterized protein LOC111832350 [Capsella rubella]|uniref:uncharacterized protein LOC111832350 n=1 Tax=Capsella rubella TaxID=81985 RepID=UPI000CD5C466|nr:uncharacterized protein LOC111832350 [Capsella rubella]